MKNALALFLVLALAAPALASSVKPVAELDHPVIQAGRPQVVHVLVSFDVADAPPEKSRARSPLNLSLVLDRSGSMSGEGKLDFAKKAASRLVDALAPSDRLAIVEYDDKIAVLWPSSPVEAPDLVKRAVETLRPRGSTNLTGGMMRGVGEVEENPCAGCLARVILLSDGLANTGIVNPMEIRSLVREANGRGVRITTMGLGRDYNEDLMTLIAENGGGNYYFIENPDAMARVFEEEMSILFRMLTEGASLVFKPGPGVSGVKVYGAKTRDKEGGTEILTEDFYSGEKRILLLRLEVSPRPAGPVDLGELALSYEDLAEKKKTTAVARLSATADTDSVLVAKKENPRVSAEAALVLADDEHEKAVKLYEQGRKTEARAMIQSYQGNLSKMNRSLKDVRIGKKIEALQMEEAAMDRADSDAAYKQSFLKGRKQAFYAGKKGKRSFYLMQEGARGMEVERLQMELKKRGFYKGPVDGEFDGDVTRAVKELQKAEGLSVDGIAGPATLAALGLY